MNIGIDVRRTRGQITGVGVYVIKFVEALKRIDRDNSYSYFLGEAHTRGVLSNPYFLELVWKQIATPLELASKKIDVFFVPNPPVSFPAPCPTVLMIPDVALCSTDELNRQNRFNKFFYQLSARSAKRVVTISECSRNDIVQHLSVSPSKIDIVPLACDEIFKPSDRIAAQAAVRACLGTSRRLILAVPGTLTPRKGMLQLLDAFARLPDQIRLQYQLAIVAKKDAAYPDFMAQIEKRQLAADVIVTGYIAHAEMPTIYNSADLLVYPSQYEGFGLPPLEAMACGTPVIASNTSSVPEVVADAGILVNPLRVDQISAAMFRVLSEKDLQDELRQKGLKRATAFSWDKSAAALLQVLKSVSRRK